METPRLINRHVPSRDSHRSRLVNIIERSVPLLIFLSGLVCSAAASAGESPRQTGAANVGASRKDSPPGPRIETWTRWERELTSSKAYPNPYYDVVLQVTYVGPGGQRIAGYGFWDGGETFRIRCMFPSAGRWTWRTTCSGESNAALHNQAGEIDVVEYRGTNALYKRGCLKISADKRYLTYGDGTPFLWIGDTAWNASYRANQAEWEAYVRDRAAKKFTVIQTSARVDPTWDGADGKPGRPFTGAGMTRWNPAFWQAFDEKVSSANEQGLAVLVIGVSNLFTKAIPSEADVRLFARSLAARLMGSHVLFSPGFDENEFGGVVEDRNVQVGDELRRAAPFHLVTNHPNPDEPNKFYSERYYDKPFAHFAGLQSGRGKPDPPSAERCAQMTIERCLVLYARKPWKPLVNLETRYDSPYTQKELGRLPRSCGYWSFLSGAVGYSYGCDAIWNWGHTHPALAKFGEQWTFAEGIRQPSSLEMRYLCEFLSGIQWWRLAPAPERIRNQPSQWARKMAFAQTSAGDLAVAYLPDNEELQLDLAGLPTPMLGRWFNPKNGTFSELQVRPNSAEMATIRRPAPGDWVLVLTPAARAVAD